MAEPALHAATLDLLRNRREVRIETRSASEVVHRTIVWVVVDDRDRVLVRSYRGAGARWYREALSGRPVVLEIGRTSLPVGIEVATDPERVRACSRALEAKYAGDRATPAMLRDEVLDTTLELTPRG
jgi:hypothetical protein